MRKEIVKGGFPVAIAKKIIGFITESSMIRRMFEEGLELKKMHGVDNVYDFSLGNPDVPPPVEFQETLERVVREPIPGKHGYMPNAGYPETRRAVAAMLERVHDVAVTEDCVIMTCGAGGALNVIFHTLLDPGDEVIIPVPCFVEYNFYVDHAGGIAKWVTMTADFSLDLVAIERAISPRTKAILINSPHNPTGRVYPRETLTRLGGLLHDASKTYGREIYIISDEPYRDIVYDNIEVPSVFAAYEQSIIANSYSKSLSLAGERIGYLAVHPGASERGEIMAGLVFSNRTLGFVNAPALMQRVIARIPDAHVDVSVYERKRNALYEILAEVGYDCILPEGAFYLFPRSPMIDDNVFIQVLKKYRVLAVPGSSFLCPGYFRLAYCVDDRTIERSRPGFRAAYEEAVTFNK